MGKFTRALTLNVIMSVFATLIVAELVVFTFCKTNVHDRGMCKERLGRHGPISFLKGGGVFFVISVVLYLTKPIVVNIGRTEKVNTVGCDLSFMNNASAGMAFSGRCALRRVSDRVVPDLRRVAKSGGVRIRAMGRDGRMIFGARALSLRGHRTLTSCLGRGCNMRTSSVTARGVDSAMDSRVEESTIVTIVVTAVYVLLCV